MAQPVHYIPYHPFITLQEPPHHCLESRIMHQNLCMLQDRIRMDCIHRRHIWVQKESVNMVFQAVIPQTLLHQLLRSIPCKRHLQYYFYSFLMAGLHHVFQFSLSVAGSRVSTLRRKVICRAIPPIIPETSTLFELIYGHALDLIDPQIFQIRQLFHDTRKRAFFLHSRGCMFCKSPDMQAVSHDAMEGKLKRLISLPVISAVF